MKKFLTMAALTTAMMISTTVMAKVDTYVIDDKGAHASINFKVKHLGIGWVTGRFNDFTGTLSIDSVNPANSKVSVTIDTASIDSNHALRDKHLRSKDFLDVTKFPNAKFISTGITNIETGKFNLTGNLTLHGITKSVVIGARNGGQGNDPWGGYRVGFEGATTILLSDFGIVYNAIGVNEIELTLTVEAIRTTQ